MDFNEFKLNTLGINMDEFGKILDSLILEMLIIGLIRTDMILPAA